MAGEGPQRCIINDGFRPSRDARFTRQDDLASPPIFRTGRNRFF
jgi:hypothetical protein